jgi:hypothetical protein
LKTKAAKGEVQLPNYQITNQNKELRRQDRSGKFEDQESGNHEGSGISKKDLRQMQDRAPQGCGACDLRKLETQAEAGIIFANIGNSGNLKD